MTEPVNFELAKLLKEKGFGIIKYSNSKNKTKSYRPTIAETIMWLYKKHKIWIYVHKDGGWWFPVIENYYDEDDQGTIIEDLSKLDRNYFNKQTEAYEKAIEYTLKNLI